MDAAPLYSPMNASELAYWRETRALAQTHGRFALRYDVEALDPANKDPGYSRNFAGVHRQLAMQAWREAFLFGETFKTVAVAAFRQVHTA